MAPPTVQRAQEGKAWAWLRKHDQPACSSADATSFQVMRNQRLREALAFDQGFAAVGFLELRPNRSSTFLITDTREPGVFL